MRRRNLGVGEDDPVRVEVVFGDGEGAVPEVDLETVLFRIISDGDGRLGRVHCVIILTDSSSGQAARVKRHLTVDALRGDCKGEWALTVTPNWRLTFRVNEAGAIEDMDLEDYH
jgi:proteic killer suppression protein